MGRRFQRLGDLCWRLPWGPLIPIIYLASGWEWGEMGLAASSCPGGPGDLLEYRVNLRAPYGTSF